MTLAPGPHWVTVRWDFHKTSRGDDALIAHLVDVDSGDRGDIVYLIQRAGPSATVAQARARALGEAVHAGYLHTRHDELEITLQGMQDQAHLVGVVIGEKPTHARLGTLGTTVATHAWSPVPHALGLDGAPRALTAAELATIAELRAGGDAEVLGDWLEWRGLRRSA